MKFVFIILSILCFQLSLSQKKAENGKINDDIDKFVNNYKLETQKIPLKVEDIKNDWDVVKFINNYFLKTKKRPYKVSFCDKQGSFLPYNKEEGHFYDSIRRHTNWFTMDINSDGKLDLVFCGCMQDDDNTVLFLSGSNNTYKWINISPDDCSYSPNFAYRYAKDTMVFGGAKRFEDSAGGKFLIQKDTIIYSKTGLTEINSNNTDRKIDSLKLELSVPLRDVRRKCLTVFKHGVLKMETLVQDNDVWWIKKYVRLNSAKQANAILGLAEGLPYDKYLKQYDCDAMDGFVWITNVFFTDKTASEIVDHMGIAPFGLRSIYNYVDQLFDDKNWKLVSTERDPTAINIKYNK